MLANLLLILNLCFVEVLLSIDNSTVLAILIKDLPKEQSTKALRYGILGAYTMRGLSLFLVSLLVKLWWLKALGGIYLLYLTYGFFTKKADTIEEDLSQGTDTSKLYRWIQSTFKISKFWTIIILVELVDMTLSIDNIFASVALSQNLWVIFLGVFIGIAAMRWVAGKFVDIMARTPSLETSAYVVIGLLGIKLIVSCFASKGPFWTFYESQWFSILFSIVMMGIFFFPLLSRYDAGISLDTTDWLGDEIDDFNDE